MAAGAHLNTSEDRAVMHLALRASDKDSYAVDGKDVVPDVLKVRDQIKKFSEDIRR
jgi:glucose-6-phosphate isomerase